MKFVKYVLFDSIVAVLYIADDYENGPFMVQFQSNETVKTVSVATVQDDLFERNEIFDVTLQVQDEYQQLGIDIDSKTSTIKVTLNNDDGMILCIVYHYIVLVYIRIEYQLCGTTVLCI